MKKNAIIPALLVAFASLTSLFAAAAEATAPILFAELSAKATAEDKGRFVGITATAEGAELRTGFQKLSGTVTCDGLRLLSTEAEGGSLQLKASAIGRTAAVSQKLPATGTVSSTEKWVAFNRQGFVEEYSVSADGVRQDFVIAQRPVGTGALSVELALSGASAEASADGAKLTMAGSGRVLAYNRLHVTDASGRVLVATLDVLSSTQLAVRVEDADAIYPVRIDPTFSDADWVSMNPGIPGANNTVSAMVVDGNGNLYVGGSFTFIGTVAANRIAKWNGSAWSALGTGMDSTVSALAVSGSDLYAGGNFSLAGGVPNTARIAKWNGSAWSALGTGTNGTVSALAVFGSDLYAGGSFSLAGGVASTARIARWNGSSWSALGTGTNGNVNALAVIGGDLYAGGQFSLAGGVASTARIAKWNGSAWSPLGTGTNGTVSALAVIGSDLYAGGQFGSAAGVANTARIAKWNGSAWSALGTGMDSTVSALAVIGGDLFAGGSFSLAGGVVNTSRIAKWDGSAWSALGTGMESTVSTLAAVGSDLYAGGSFTTAGGVLATRIAKWSGSAWSALGTGMDSAVNALAVNGSDLYVGGNFTTAGGVANTRYIAKWNGSVWSALGTGMSGTVSALAVIGSDLYAGGSFTAAGGVANTSRIAKWDGSAWSALGTGMNSTVNTLAVIGSDLYAGGGFTTAGGVAANRIAKWNGSGWSALGTGADWFVNALAVIGSDLYAAGGFGFAGGTPANFIAKWNGTAWSALGSGLSVNPAYSLAVIGSDLYVGGQFTAAGGVANTGSIAKWNGSAWSALGTGIGGTVNASALAVIGSDLYVGGGFTTAGGTSANRIAKWDGSVWSALGTGMDGPVSALAADASGNLFIGGSFSLAGTTVSPYIAQANLSGSPLGTTIIDDDFDNGALGTNPNGTGTGFDSNGQVAVGEAGGFVNMNTTNGVSTMVIASKNNLNPFTSTATTATFRFGAVNYDASWHRLCVGWRLATTSEVIFYPYGLIQPSAQGLYVVLFAHSGEETAKGNLYAVDDSGVHTRIASWNWSSNTQLSNLVVTLTTTASTYQLGFSGATAAPTFTTGAASGLITGLGTLGANFEVGVHNQIGSPAAGAVQVDRITVTTDTPSPSPTDVVFVANKSANTIRRYTAPGVSTVYADSADGISDPEGMAVDASGNLYVTNSGNNTVIKILPNGTASVFADSADGVNGPQGIAIDAANNLYVGNTGNLTVTKITPTGTGSLFGSTPGGFIRGVAVDSSGNVYVSNAGSRIDVFTPAGVRSTYYNGPALTHSNGLTIDSAGILYCADFDQNKVVKFATPGFPTTYANTLMNAPIGVGFGANGKLYVANFYGSIVSAYSDAGVDTTFANDTTGVSSPTAVAIIAGTTSNAAPTALALSASSIVENVAANSTVGTLNTTDPDFGNTFTYSLVSGSGSTDNAAFNISGSSLRITDSPDFETKSSYAVRVRTTDQGSLSFEQTFTITITNVNEMPGFAKGSDHVHAFGIAPAQSFSAWATAIDDGDSTVTQGLTFSVSVVSGGSIFSTAPGVSPTGTLSYTLNGNAGTANINISLTDDPTAGGAALTTTTQTFTITVQSAPDYTVSTAGDAIIVTDSSGNGDTLTVSEPSAGEIQFAAAGRTFSVNGGLLISGNSGVFTRTSVTSITVNAAAGSDTINVGAFTGSSFPSLTINGGTDNDSVNLNGDITFVANAHLDLDLQNDAVMPGTDLVSVAASANLLTSGTGTIMVKVSRSVALNVGSSLETVNGGITIEANQQTSQTTLANIGVSVAGGLIQSTGTGIVSVKGKGGTLNGITVSSAGCISGGTMGNTTVIGVGGVGTSSQVRGVLITGVNSRVVSNGANIIVEGTGGNLSSSVSVGLELGTGAIIIPGGSGYVSLIGTGGASGSTRNAGVAVYGAGALLASSGGNISVVGIAPGAGSTNPGIDVGGGGRIVGGGLGSVTLNGTGGSTLGSGHRGVWVQHTNSQVTSSGGNISITGACGGTAASSNCVGISIDFPAQVSAGGSGTVTLDGSGGPGTGGTNHGVSINGSGSPITSAGGSVLVSGTKGGGSTSLGLNVTAPTAISTASNGGNITLIANTMNISGAISGAGSSIVTLYPTTNSTPIDLGAADSANTLGLTDAELDLITAGTLAIGNASSGAITVSAVISPLNYKTLALNKNTSFSSTGGFASDIGATAAMYEKITVTGSVSIHPAATLSLAATGGYVPAVEQGFMLINNDSSDSIIGTFSNFVQGATIPNFLSSGLNAKISYSGQTGNDLVVSTPQPVLTVVADNKTRAYRAANPVFTGTISGVQPPDVITATYATSATSTSNVGTYPIVATLSGANLANYTVINTPGTLTITPAGTTVAAVNKTVVVSPGAQNVSLTATVLASSVTVNMGTVTFQLKNGAANVGSAVVSSTVSGGSATVTYPLPAATSAGIYTIETTYSGAINFGASSNSTRTLTVIAQPVLASLVVSGFANPATAGTASTFTVTAKNGSGNTITVGYSGTVSFSSSDVGASLPANYTFTPADAGVKTFTATLREAGTHTLAVTDGAAVKTGSQTGIVVNPRAGVTRQLYSWGNNDGAVWERPGAGQLGDGTTMQRNTRVPVSGFADAISVAGGFNHSLAVKPDGSVWAWGANFQGMLGNATSTQSLVPVQVKGVGGVGTLAGITKVAAGDYHSLALKSDGTVWAWGYGGFGALGDGTGATRLSPVQVTGLTGVTAIATGRIHSMALKSDGTVWCWGRNYSGELGDNTTTQSNAPVQVKGPDGIGVLTGVTAIAGGFLNGVALKSDGTVWAWGDNREGQLGDNTITDRSAPVQVKGPGGVGTLNGVTRIAGNDGFAVALKSDGTVWTWGWNGSGGLGDGTIISSPAPVQVKGPDGIGTISDVAEISGGNDYALAVKTDGSLWAWGGSTYGQIGNGTTNPIQPWPVQPSGFTSAMLLGQVGSGFHSLAVDGTPTATRFIVTAPSSTNAGVPFDITVTSLDAAGNSVAHTGTVRFTSNDLIAGLPANYTFLAGDQGRKTFTVTLNSSGLRSVAITDTGTPTITGSAAVAVGSLATVTTTQTVATSFDSVDQAVTLTAQVTSVGGTVNQGLVTFQVRTTDGTDIGTAVISGVVVNGLATASYLIPGGTMSAIYAVHASYTGGDSYSASSGSAGKLRLGQAPTNMATVTESAAVPYSLASQTVGLSASVTSTAGTVNEGTITFRILDSSSNVIETARTSMPLVSGSEGVTYMLSPGLPAGDYTIEASYSGGVNYESSIGTSTLTVGARTSLLAVTGAITNFSNLAQNISFFAQVTSPAGTLGEGDVTFQLKTAGGINVGSAVTSASLIGGSALVTYVVPAAQSPGTYSLFATYNGSGNISASSDNTKALDIILNPVSTSVVAGALQANATPAAQNLTLSATVVGKDEPVHEGTVTFQVTRDGNNVGTAVTSTTVANGAASVTYVLPAGTPGGRYVIEVTYQGTPNFRDSLGSGPLSLNAIPTDITLSTTNIAENNAANATIGTLDAADADVTDEHSFFLVPGTGDADNESFSIEGNALKLLSSADFETQPSYSIRVNVFDGSNNFAMEFTVTVTDVNEAPVISAISPNSGSTAGGTSVTITGKNFAGATSVTIGNVVATSFTIENDTTITATTPAGTAGAASVLVIAPDGTNEANTLFTYLLSPIEIWRQTHFGSIANSGDGANGFDFDKDGLANLVEYAFGLVPVSGGSLQIPQAQRIGSDVVISFTQPGGVSGIIYGAEWSTTLLPGSWTPLSDTGVGSTHTFSVPVEGNTKMFLRLRVTEP
jgi:alpha-tubulin suppressor-like RCC1 family protein